MFGTKDGWERADHLEPGRPWRAPGETRRAWGWARPPWFERVGDEPRAVRERVGLIDLISFGKIAVEGPGRAWPAAARVGERCRSSGRLGRLHAVARRARRIVADVTVIRLARRSVPGRDRCWLRASDLGWLRAHVADEIRRRSATSATSSRRIGLWGPRARDVLAAVTATMSATTSLPLRSARARRLGGGARCSPSGSATPASSAGSSYLSPAWAVAVWDCLVEAGAAVRPRSVRLPGARLAPDREGLPLLRRRT